MVRVLKKLAILRRADGRESDILLFDNLLEGLVILVDPFIFDYVGQFDPLSRVPVEHILQ